MLLDDIPDGLFRQMTTCQTAANEFLRQFWLATYQPSGDVQTVVMATPQQRVAKQAKMIGYISRTHEKVNALVQVAQQHGIDTSRVEIVSFKGRLSTFADRFQAMRPVVHASEQALAFWRNRKPPKA